MRDDSGKEPLPMLGYVFILLGVVAWVALCVFFTGGFQ